MCDIYFGRRIAVWVHPCPSAKAAPGAGVAFFHSNRGGRGPDPPKSSLRRVWLPRRGARVGIRV